MARFQGKLRPMPEDSELGMVRKCVGDLTKCQGFVRLKKYEWHEVACGIVLLQSCVTYTKNNQSQNLLTFDMVQFNPSRFVPSILRHPRGEAFIYLSLEPSPI
jgi:hypothetical protein